MSLFDSILGSSAGGGAGALDAGRVEASIGYRHDDRGLREWEAELRKARAQPDVEAELRGDFDSRGFAAYDRALATSRAGSAKGVAAAQKLESGILRVGKAGLYGGGILAGAFAVGAYKAVGAASDLNESINAADAIFEKSAPKIQRWSKTAADGFGLARTEALGAASSIGAMLKPMGFTVDKASVMSRKMVELAGDMASFNNEDPSEMLERIRSGLAGESEPLRRFGVDLRVSAVEAFALKEGLIQQGEALEGQKFTLAAYQKILADTTDQQGDFARTSDGLANMQRRLRANFIDVGASLGKDLLPYMQEASSALNDFLVDMKRGTGAGGDFARWLEGAGKDVAAFVEELGGIAGDPSLETEEKIRQIVGKLSDVAIDAFREAVPAIAGSAGRAAPQVALAFVQGFLDAPILGKLLIANWAAKIFGGKTLLQRAGSTIGGSMAAGVAAGATNPTTGVGGTKMAGRFRGALGGLKSVAKGVGATVLAFGLIDGISGGIETAARGGNFEQSVSDGLTEAFRSVGIDLGPTWKEIFDEGAQTALEEAAKLPELLGTGAARAFGGARGLERMTDEDMAEIAGLPGSDDWNNFTDEQKARLRKVFDAMRAAARLFRKTGIKAKIDLDDPLSPKDLDRFSGNLEQLKRGVFVTFRDINKASKSNSKIIGDNFERGSRSWRKATAENLRATAAAYGQAMERSGNVTKKGLKHVAELVRKADLVEGIHPERFGREFAKAFDKAGKVTKDGLDAMIRDMRRLPDGQRQAAFDAMMAQLKQLRKQRKLSGDEYREIRSGALAEFDDLEKGASKSSKKLADGVLGNVLRLGVGIADVLETNKVNLNEALEAFEVDPVKYTVTKPKVSGGRGRQRGGFAGRFERGGFLDGVGREDTVPVLAAPDEAFLTSWHQGPVELGLQVSKALGIQPYGSLDDLFRRDSRTHRSGPRRTMGGAERFERGGRVSGQMGAMIALVNKYEQAHYPYEWGGGHGGFVNGTQPVDCSGFVSDVLHAGGLLDGAPMVSGALMNWGQPAQGNEPLVVYSNPGHVVMSLNGRVAGTSGSNPGGGAGWIEGGNGAALAPGAKRTMNASGGAVMAELAKVMLEGPAGPMLDLGNAIATTAWKGASDYLSRQAPSGMFGGGDFGPLGKNAVRGRATWFTGGLMASGKNTDTAPGIALNPNPGGPDPASWNNPTTRQWLSREQPFLVEIGGKKASLPVLDMGPAGWTGNAIDVDRAGVSELGFSTSNFPSGTIGTATPFLAQRGGWVLRNGGGRSGGVDAEAAIRNRENYAREIRKVENKIEDLRDRLNPKKGKAPKGDERKALQDRLEDLQKDLSKLEKKRRRHRKRHARNVERAGIPEKLEKRLRALNKRIAATDETIDLRERDDTKPGSPGGEELTPDEVLGQVAANRGLEKQLLRKRQLLGRITDELVGQEKFDDRKIAHARRRDSSEHWLLESYRANRSRVRELLRDARDQMVDTIGVTRKGGRLYDVREKIGQLKATESAVDSPATDAINELLRAQIAELQRDQAIRAAQGPIFAGLGFQRGGRLLAGIAATLRAPYGGSFGTGGIVPGPRGAPRTITAHGGERISRDGEPKVDVYVYTRADGTADVEVAVDGVLRKRTRSAGLSRQLPSFAGSVPGVRRR